MSARDVMLMIAVWAIERALRREGAAEVLQSLVGKLDMFRGKRFRIDLSGKVTELPLDAAPPSG